MDSTLSVEVEHDYLPDWNRMLSLPEVGDGDDVDKRLARASRLRVWRSGPAEPNELRLAVEAEVAEAVEHGELSAAEAADRIERVCAILASDTSIADPPDVDEVTIILEECRERYGRVHRPFDDEEPDRYGNWPGVNWRKAVEHSLSKSCNAQGPKVSTSMRVAWLLLRHEKIERARAVADQEKAARIEAVAQAHGRLPIVFEDERQTLLKFVVGQWAYGDLKVPTSGAPIAEASLLAELLEFDPLGLSEAAVSEVGEELIRFVAAWPAAADSVQTVPTVGYAIQVIDDNIVDVFPGHIRLTIEGSEHVLHAPQFPRPVRMSAKMFRDPRLCAQAIYDQTLVEVDIPRGHWRKWWPVLAARLNKTARIVEAGQRVEGWQQFALGVTATAPDSPHALPDGAPYRSTRDGKCYFGKKWMIEQAVAAGVIGLADRKAFSDWLGTADKNRRDAEGGQHWLLNITGTSSPCIEAACEPGENSDAACSKDANEP